MKMNIKDYNKAKSVINEMNDVLVNKQLNCVFIVTTKDDITSNVVSNGHVKFHSSAKNNISVGVLHKLETINELSIYNDLLNTNEKDFVSLRLFDFDSYDELIQGHLFDEISSQGAANFFEKYRNVLENHIMTK